MNEGEKVKWLAKALSLPEGESPFPWQERLLDRFISGEVPGVVDIPTGLGKTAVMAIWLAARAFGARLPRRLVYVVDRRAVVDQATEEAMRLRAFVDGDRQVQKILAIPDGRSLPISTLRGQYVDNREWLDDPAAPAIIVGTVDMIGSRLLFEGYGVSRKMRPYHAGLLGADTLVVLDEAHLVPPLEHLLRSVATEPAFRGRDEKARCRIPPLRLLTLSATGRTQTNNAMGLTDEDFKHDVVKKRLNAKKSLQIEELNTDSKLEVALAEHAWTLADEGRKAVRVLVYSDSREVARKAKEEVEKLAKGDKKTGKAAVEIQTELFVGGPRVFEREAAKQRLEKLGLIAGQKVDRNMPVFLFATSAGEVGVDLDADHMVCDLVAWERMVQRLGRVNRRGDGEARIIVITPRVDDKIRQALDKQQRGEELTAKERKAADAYNDGQRQLEALKKLPVQNDGTRDASPGALRELKKAVEQDNNLRETLQSATTPEPLRPALTRALVDAWAMTSLETHTGRPAIQPWLRGWVDDEPPQTAVVWRKYLPVRAGDLTPGKKEIEGFFEAAPPHTSEILETETFRVVEWVAARAKSLRKQQAEQHDVTNQPHPRDEDVVAFALDPDGGLRRTFKLQELGPFGDKKELRNLLAGATLIVDARLAGLRDGLLDEADTAIPRTADDGQDWLGEDAVGFRVRAVDSGAQITKESNWRERCRFANAVAEDGEVTRWLIVEKWREDAATEEDRSAGNPQLLHKHQSWTEDRARRLAKHLGLDDALLEVLALAARLHDEGKRALRWQRAFHAPNDDIYAKTEGPIDYRLLDGYRHEVGSLLQVEKAERILKLPEEHRDLVLHLITAHHGFARPVIGTSGCEDAPPSALEDKAAEIALRFARLQDRWGPWGLAWWEALLRAADQQASRDNDARGASKGGA